MENIKNKNIFTSLKKLWPYLRKSKKYIIMYSILSIFEIGIGIVLPLVSAKIILNITNGLMKQLLYASLTVLIIESFSHLFRFLKDLLYIRIYENTLTSLQIAIAEESLKLEIQEIDKKSSGVFIDRLNKDTEEISGLFMEYAYWIAYVLSNFGILFTIFILNKYLFVYAIITSACIFIINKVRLQKQYKLKKQVKKLNEKKTSLTSELIKGIRDIKLLNAADNILEQTTDKIIETSKKETTIMNIRRRYLHCENFFKSFSDFVLIVLGCVLYKKSLLTIPTFIIIYNYQPKIKNLLNGVVQILEYNKRFILAADRIFEIVEDGTFKKEKFGKKHIDNLKGKIEFKNVKFKYDDYEVLKDLSFTINPNEKVAFVGKSGGGKTTIFNLITKLYTANSGKILLDDTPINSLDYDTIRSNIGVVTQNPYIFDLSIKENLLLVNKDASMDEIRKACKLACLDRYIMRLPNKYDTILGENGITLSGGQKQRLAIARALIMKSKIILFDEATSALDNETQDKIQEAIQNLDENYTIIIVAHRLSTVIDCDKIFVLDQGKVVESGTHKELIKKSEIYKSLYNKDMM